MLKFFSFILSVIMIVISLEYFISLAGGGFGFIEEKYLFIVYVVGTLISMCSFFFITEKKEVKDDYVTINDIKFQEKVLIQLVDSILKEKNQLKEYKINFNENTENIFIFEVEAVPNLETEFSFHVFVEETSKEIKDVIEKYTSHEKTKTLFNFRGKEEKKK